MRVDTVEHRMQDREKTYTDLLAGVTRLWGRLPVLKRERRSAHATDFGCGTSSFVTPSIPAD
jgi:hypothetical protein